MRWPFGKVVSFDVAQACIEPWKAIVAEQNHMIHELQEMLRAEIAYNHALKVNGAVIPEPTKTLERPEFDPVMAAITAKAGPDRKLRAMMAGEAMRSRQAGIDDVEIIRAIEQGVTIDDEEGVVL